MLAGGRDPNEALDYLANTLTGKLLHGPSVRLRKAAEHGDQVLLDAATRLFDADGRDA
jgi:glutamyl-tRNA reductase